MKLILSLTLIWSLCSSAEALRCLNGTNDLTNLQTCASDDLRCITTHTQVFFENKPQEVKRIIHSFCGPSAICALHGQTFSSRTGPMASAESSHCCDTDGCNQAFHLPDSEMQKVNVDENGLQCFGCSDPLDKVCNMRVKCLGVQDRCIDGTVSDGRAEISAHLITGCVSANTCDRLPALQQAAAAHGVNVISNIQCCGSSFCNSAWTAELSAAPLLFGLIVYFVL